MIAYFRLFADLPGVTFVEQDVTWVASKGVPGNQVLRTRLSTTISHAALDQRIDELLAGGIAGIFDVSTPIAFRRQGFGSAISWTMLQEAQRRAIQTPMFGLLTSAKASIRGLVLSRSSWGYANTSGKNNSIARRK